MSTAGTPARPVGMTVQVGGRAIQLPPWQALAAPVFIVMMLAMMILPLPALLLDLFFTFNIAVAVVVLLVTTGAETEKNCGVKLVGAAVSCDCPSRS